MCVDDDSAFFCGDGKEVVEREIFFSVSMTRAIYIYIYILRERERERERERGRRCCGKSQSPKFFSSAFLCSLRTRIESAF